MVPLNLALLSWKNGLIENRLPSVPKEFVARPSFQLYIGTFSYDMPGLHPQSASNGPRDLETKKRSVPSIRVGREELIRKELNVPPVDIPYQLAGMVIIEFPVWGPALPATPPKDIEHLL
jgi:hypothetical protein